MAKSKVPFATVTRKPLVILTLILPPVKWVGRWSNVILNSHPGARRGPVSGHLAAVSPTGKSIRD